MKKIFFMLVAAIAALLPASALAGTRIQASALPAAARTFLSKYFPGDNVVKAEKDQGYRGMEYEVDLASGAEIDFKEDGSWKEVKVARGKAVPSAIVPTGIANYVKKNFSGQTIREIKFKRGGYEVELSGGSELHLTKEGTPMTGGQGRGGRGGKGSKGK